MWDYLWQLYDTHLTQQRLTEHERRCARPTVRTIRESVEEVVHAVSSDETGGYHESVVGDGTTIPLHIDAGNNHRSWYTISIWALTIATGVPCVGVDVNLSASENMSTYLHCGTIDVSQDPTCRLIQVFLPARYIRARFMTTIVGEEYHITGYWKEDR